MKLQATQIADNFTLPTQLSAYNDELQAKLVTVDTAQQNGLAALQVIANDVAHEVWSLLGQTNEANFRTAAKFTELESAWSHGADQPSGSNNGGTSQSFSA